MPSARLDRRRLQAFAQASRARYEHWLRTLVEIPTVSADPGHRRDIRRGADAACALLEEAGARARLLRTPGNPVVLGELPGPKGAPVVTLYNHLDVQPADREGEGWRTDPFKLTPRGDRYHGRGATDDKGPALACLFGAMAAREAGVPFGLRVIWELEEEIGSPHFEVGLKAHRGPLDCHSVVVSDTTWLDPRHPTCTAGLRGMVGFVFSLQTGGADSHSGDTGGAARNPLAELMALAAEIHDARSGRVKVPGFYDDVRPPTRAERQDFRSCGFRLAEFRRAYQVDRLRTEDPLEVMERIWVRPTFEVHGLLGGYTGPGLKAIVPARAELRASCRLVSRQDPKKIGALVKRFVRERNPDVRVTVAGGAPAYEAQTTGPVAEAMRRAMAFAFGKRPAFVREGGTIGAVVTLDRMLRRPIAFLNLSLPEDGYHAPNESFAWTQAARGMAAFAAYLDEVAR